MDPLGTVPELEVFASGGKVNGHPHVLLCETRGRSSCSLLL